MSNYQNGVAEAIYDERKRTYHMISTIVDMLEEETNLQTPVLKVCKDLLAQAQHRHLISSDAWYDTNYCIKNKEANHEKE